MAPAKISTVSAELRIVQSIRSKLPLLRSSSSSQAMQCRYTKIKDLEHTLGRPVSALRNKECVVTYCVKPRTYGLSQVFPSSTAPRNRDLRGILPGFKIYMKWYVPGVFLNEVGSSLSQVIVRRIRGYYEEGNKVFMASWIL